TGDHDEDHGHEHKNSKQMPVHSASVVDLGQWRGQYSPRIRGNPSGREAKATPLNQTLRRQNNVNGHDHNGTLAPDGVKHTLQGKRKGLELTWNDRVTGDAALAVALNASVGRFAEQSSE